jgi:hypothetical protein
VVSEADEHEDFWHAVIESRRLEDGSFSGEVSMDLAMALMTAANRDFPSSTEQMLLKLREWYGPHTERRAVLAVTRHFKGQGGSATIFRIARALWDMHAKLDCTNPRECSLHSMGVLWAFGWLEPASDTGWIVKALKTLVTEHPLRAWALHLVGCSANWVDEGWMSAADAEGLLESAMTAGLHEHLANTPTLADAWSRLVFSTPRELRPGLARTGNRIIAAGGTVLISPQLVLLRA